MCYSFCMGEALLHTDVPAADGHTIIRGYFRIKHRAKNTAEAAVLGLALGFFPATAIDTHPIEVMTVVAVISAAYGFKQEVD